MGIMWNNAGILGLWGIIPEAISATYSLAASALHHVPLRQSSPLHIKNYSSGDTATPMIVAM